MHYLNGQFLKDEEAKISVFDLGLLRGYGVFDYLRTYQHKPFHLKEHLDRLAFSAQEVGLTLPHTYNEITDIITHLLQHTTDEELGIKILLTGGLSDDHITPREPAHLMILTQALNPPSSIDYQEGIATITSSLKRSQPTAKTLQYTPAIIALKQGKLKNAKEVLYLNDNNEILEATTSNFFIFTREGKLRTPESPELLIGITRAVVLHLAQSHFPIEIGPIPLSSLEEAAECFITSSNKEILPVTRIDDHLIGTGKVGPHTTSLQALFRAYTQLGSWNNLSIARHQPKI